MYNSVGFIPSGWTFDKRLKIISTNIKEWISVMSHLFVAEGLVDSHITAIDSNSQKANGQL